MQKTEQMQKLPDTVRCISMMSGTSCDGIDVVVVRYSDIYHQPKHNVESHQHVELSSAYKNIAHEVMENQNMVQAFRAGQLLAQLYAQAAHTVMQDCDLTPRDIDFLCVSGHTLFHQAPQSSQNGVTIDTTDLSMVAALTQIPTIGKFRQKDIALGGHGAPMVPFAHPYIFSLPHQDVLIQNMGGIGNVTVLHQGKPEMGFDTGPGNTWMDLVTLWHTQGRQHYDQDGAIAKKGAASNTLVDQLLMHDFFVQKPPKSTGLGMLGKSYLSSVKNKIMDLSVEDALATVTFATAKSIALAYQDWIFSSYNPQKVILCGGGAKNKTLVSTLGQLLPHIEVVTSDVFGVDPHTVEAISFGYLGLFRLLEKNNTIASITGSFKPSVGGEIACGDQQ